MIHFFRRIRKQLADDNKPIKYFRYAIGEIVLVVIGILIALSINNWNEHRKEDINLYNIYEVVVKDLKNDINDINGLLKYYETIKPKFNKVLDGEMTNNDYLNCLECLNLIRSYPDLSLDVRGYNQLNNYKNINNKKKDDLITDIVQFYTKQLYEIRLDERIRNNGFDNNFEYWKSNYSWFSDFITDRNVDGFTEYAVNSQDYKNRVGMHYMMTYSVVLTQYSEFKNKAEILINRIEKINAND